MLPSHQFHLCSLHHGHISTLPTHILHSSGTSSPLLDTVGQQGSLPHLSGPGNLGSHHNAETKTRIGCSHIEIQRSCTFHELRKVILGVRAQATLKKPSDKENTLETLPSSAVTSGTSPIRQEIISR